MAATTKAKKVKPKSAEPKAVKLKPAEPKAVKLKSAEPKAVKLKPAEPKAVKLKSAELKAVKQKHGGLREEVSKAAQKLAAKALKKSLQPESLLDLSESQWYLNRELTWL